MSAFDEKSVKSEQTTDWVDAKRLREFEFRRLERVEEKLEAKLERVRARKRELKSDV